MNAAHKTLLSEDVKMALETIRTHKVRSFLTVLGVVIGVTVAITVSSILLGFEDSVQASFNEFGVNNLFVFKFQQGFREGSLRKSVRASPSPMKTEWRYVTICRR